MGAKHKKTRRQKIIADYRRQVYILENKNISQSKNINPTITNGINSYSYVLHDVSRTLILTLGLIGLQIILFFIVRKHILLIPYLNY